MQSPTVGRADVKRARTDLTICKQNTLGTKRIFVPGKSKSHMGSGNARGGRGRLPPERFVRTETATARKTAGAVPRSTESVVPLQTPYRWV